MVSQVIRIGSLTIYQIFFSWNSMLIKLDHKSHIHIIGIGGSGMSALALLLLDMNYSISGSDLEENPYIANIRDAGAKVWIGSKPECIPSHSTIFYSTAVPNTDSERVYAEKKEYPIYQRHVLLTWLTQQFFTIAITGTHGKTTTTAWIGFLLSQAQFDPTVIAGGNMYMGNNIHIGRGQYNGQPLMVIEADESDSSFLSIDANIAIITNIDMDHPDQHASFTDLQETFKKFIYQTYQNKGQVIFSSEIPNHVIKNIIMYEEANPPYTAFQEYTLKLHDMVRANKNGYLTYDKQRIHISLMGQHNLYNASAILQLGIYMNLKLTIIKQALHNFKGVNRRMELIQENSSFDVMDDYAHHPREIQMVYEALCAYYHNIYIFWEPHRISRFCYFFDAFYNLFDTIIGWDNLFLLPIYKAGDQVANFPNFNTQIAKFSCRARKYLSSKIDYSTLTQYLYDNCKIHKRASSSKKNIIVFMGAGQSSEIAYKLIQNIK